MMLDFNTAVNAILIAGALGAGRTMWKTAVLVERLDERTKDHGERIERLEDHAA